MLHPLPVLIVTILMVSSSSSALALDTSRDEIQSFINELAQEHGFEETYVQGVLDQTETKQKILDAISRPAERTRPWHEYRDIFMTEARISAGVEFWNEHGDSLEYAAAETGVPPEVIAAIIGVETFYGRITGSYRVVDALATLGFDYPPRAKFFRGQLEEVFLLAREEELELTELLGSYAGAMGPPQFIPSSYRAYAVDGDGDGRRDLLGNWDDILMSVGNYFVKNGWKSGQPVAVPATSAVQGDVKRGENKLKMTSTVAELQTDGFFFDSPVTEDTASQLITLEGKTDTEYWIGFHNFYVITRYNRSSMYALAVFQLSEALSAAKADADAAAEAAIAASSTEVKN